MEIRMICSLSMFQEKLNNSTSCYSILSKNRKINIRWVNMFYLHYESFSLLQHNSSIFYQSDYLKKKIRNREKKEECQLWKAVWQQHASKSIIFIYFLIERARGHSSDFLSVLNVPFVASSPCLCFIPNIMKNLYSRLWWKNITDIYSLHILFFRLSISTGLAYIFFLFFNFSIWFYY